MVRETTDEETEKDSGNLAMLLPTHAGPTEAGLTSSRAMPTAAMWPGLAYSWMPPTPWGTPGEIPNRICIGAQCWPRAGITQFGADNVANVLRSRSWPVDTMSRAAVALYRDGFYRQARGILDVYGGRHGVDAVARAMRIANGGFR